MTATRHRPVVGAAALVLLGAAAACGGREAPPVAAPPPAPVVWLVTVAPRGAPVADEVVGLPDGARLLALDPAASAAAPGAAPGAAPVDLGAGLASAGDGCVTADATRVAFVGRRTPTDPWGVWTCAPDGSERRAVATGTADAAAPAWLPDGRLVFAMAVPDPAPLPALRRAWALFVADDAGGAPSRITFGAALDLDPTLLADGRVLYAAWQPGPSDGHGRFALFTVHPDGTGAARLHGDAATPPYVRRPRVGVDGTIAFVAGALPGGDGARASRAFALDPRNPAAAAVEVPAARGARVVAPDADDGWVVASGATWGRLARGAGTPQPAAVGLPTDVEVAAATALAERPRPQGHLSLVEPREPWGQLLALDARFPATPGAARVRVRRYDRAAPYAEGAVLLETDLAADGSFFLRIPPDAPVLIDLVDAAGATVERSTTPVWVRPRETRGCVGCHEAPDVSPANRRPAAVLRDAVSAFPEVAR